MKTLKLVQSDSYLRPYASAIEGRYNYALYQEKKLTGGQKLSDWANGYMYFGLHQVTGESQIEQVLMFSFCSCNKIHITSILARKGTKIFAYMQVKQKKIARL